MAGTVNGNGTVAQQPKRFLYMADELVQVDGQPNMTVYDCTMAACKLGGYMPSSTADAARWVASRCLELLQADMAAQVAQDNGHAAITPAPAPVAVGASNPKAHARG